LAAISSAPRPRAESSETRARPWVARTILAAALIACDTLAVNAALGAVYRWHLLSDADLEAAFVAVTASAPLTGSIMLLLFNLVMAVSFVASGLYTLPRGVSRIDEAFKVVVAVTLGAFASLIVNALQPSFQRDPLPINQSVLLFGWAATVTGVVLLRVLHRSIISALRARGVDNRRVLIVGAREPGRVVAATIRRLPELGYRVQGFLSDSEPVGAVVDDLPVLGATRALGRVVRTTRADEVIIALSGRTSSEIFDIVALAEDESVEIKLYPDSFQLITNNGVSIGDISGLPLLPVKNIALDNPLNQGLKRALDVIVAGVVLTFASPVLLLIAALIRLESRGPVFFVQERVGLDNRPFPTLKFRTMRADAPDLGNWTTKDDPRITHLGRFLRRYSLDEMPQFINVIRGEMSVVGPRPEQPVWVEHFSQSIPRYMSRHKQKAGITGWAQINGLRGDTSIEERTRYDLYYVENWSLLFDIKIIVKTVVDILTGRNQGT
jgi:Undecaprenyl-phosphate glucose phosphotransferase